MNPVPPLPGILGDRRVATLARFAHNQSNGSNGIKKLARQDQSIKLRVVASSTRSASSYNMKMVHKTPRGRFSTQNV